MKLDPNTEKLRRKIEMTTLFYKSLAQFKLDIGVRIYLFLCFKLSSLWPFFLDGNLGTDLMGYCKSLLRYSYFCFYKEMYVRRIYRKPFWGRLIPNKYFYTKFFTKILFETYYIIFTFPFHYLFTEIKVLFW